MPEASPLSVLLIGCLPPPVGGVSMHVERLLARLRGLGHAARVADEAGVPPLLLPLWVLLQLMRQRLRSRPLVHVHSGNWRTRFLAALLGRVLGLPVIITVHSLRPLENPRTRCLARHALTLARGLIVTNEEIRARCHDLGAALDRIRVQHAYLDPTDQVGQLPEDVGSFLAEHQPLLVASAFRLRFVADVDLYGLDLLIELLPVLHRRHPRAGLVFVLPEVGLPDYLAACRLRLAELEQTAHFLIITRALDFPALLGRCDLLIRPTTTDGDSLSIREAQFVGCRVLASDAVTRPAGCLLFKSRDGADLLVRTLQGLETPAPTPIRDQDGWPGILAAYRSARGASRHG